jgi:hypothetical protein
MRSLAPSTITFDQAAVSAWERAENQSRMSLT